MPNHLLLKTLPQLLTNHFSPQILKQHVICVIAYGSAVFPQSAAALDAAKSNNSSKKNSDSKSQPINNKYTLYKQQRVGVISDYMQKQANSHTNSNTVPRSKISNAVDLIIIVKDTYNFHQDLFRYRPSDYTGLTRLFGSAYLRIINQYVYPVHFNHTEIPNPSNQSETQKIKYATIDLQTFVSDLQSWNLLTFAGRLHKPVALNILQSPQPQPLLTAIHNNHRMAAYTALLCLIGKVKDNEYFPVQLFYRYVSNISYAGDIRYTMAVENVNKVDNIVRNNLSEFEGLYLGILRDLEGELGRANFELAGNGKMMRIKYTPQLIHRVFANTSAKQQDKSSSNPQMYKQNLPKILIQHLQNLFSSSVYSRNPNTNLNANPNPNSGPKSLTNQLLLAGIPTIPKQINNKLSQINRRSSMRMALQNFLAASLVDNIRYIFAKIKKKGLK